jgi:SEC-C motif-containing protein
MRSRFTAFKIRRHDYLIKTAQGKENKFLLTEQDFDTSIYWLALKVISSKKGLQNDDKGIVEFVAFYQQAQEEPPTRFHQLHEESNFKKINGHWIYIDGKPLKDLKLERNEECFCGAGKKFKKCHGG